MRSVSDNSVQITNNSGQIGAAGRNARGSVSGSVGPAAHPELTRLLDELERALNGHAAELDDRATAADALDDARAEVASGTVEPRTLQRLMATVKGAASGVAAVAQAANAVRDVFQ
jgi:hypothetical protein